MDRYQYKDQWLKRGFIGGGIILLLVLLLGFLFIKSARNEVQNARSNLSDKRRQMSDLEDMSQSIVEYRQKQEQTEDMTEDFLNYIVLKSTENFRSHLIELVGDANIRLDEINMKEAYSTELGYRKQLCDINFRAGFEDMLSFVKHLESAEYFMGIEEFQVESSGDKKKHDINMTVYSVAGMNVDAVSLEDITSDFQSVLTMPETVLETFENLLQLSEYRHVYTSVEKDPLCSIETGFKKKEKVVRHPPRLILEGIVWDEASPMAVINGELYEEGQSVSGATITRITRNDVLVNWRGRFIRLEIE